MKANLNAFDLALVFVGTLLAAIGLYRMVPIPIWRLVKTNGPLTLMLLLFIGIMVFTYKSGGLKESLSVAIVRGAQFLPLIILLCMVMGVGSVIARWHEPAIQSFVLRHPITGPFVAAIVTPTSNALVPIVESTWKIEAMRPMCLFYLQASAMMSIPLFMLRSTGFNQGSELPLRMYFTGVMISFVTLILARPICAVVETMVWYWDKYRFF